MNVRSLFRPAKAIRRAKVLVADDDAVVRETVRDRLMHRGWDILTACDGREALGTTLQSRPDLVLMDIYMPNMDGLTVLECLRREPAVRDTLVMIVTSSDRVSDITRAASWNIADYVTKPFSAAELVARVDQALHRVNIL